MYILYIYSDLHEVPLQPTNPFYWTMKSKLYQSLKELETGQTRFKRQNRDLKRKLWSLKPRQENDLDPFRHQALPSISDNGFHSTAKIQMPFQNLTPPMKCVTHLATREREIRNLGKGWIKWKTKRKAKFLLKSILFHRQVNYYILIFSALHHV